MCAETGGGGGGAQEPKACSVVLRGASKDVLNEVERNLQDAMGVARNVVADPRLVAGGGAAEMAVSRGLKDRAAAMSGASYTPPLTHTQSHSRRTHTRN